MDPCVKSPAFKNEKLSIQFPLQVMPKLDPCHGSSIVNGLIISLFAWYNSHLCNEHVTTSFRSSSRFLYNLLYLRLFDNLLRCLRFLLPLNCPTTFNSISIVGLYLYMFLSIVSNSQTTHNLPSWLRKGSIFYNGFSLGICICTWLTRYLYSRFYSVQGIVHET